MIIIQHIFVELQNGVYAETTLFLNKIYSKLVCFDRINQGNLKYITILWRSGIYFKVHLLLQRKRLLENEPCVLLLHTLAVRVVWTLQTLSQYSHTGGRRACNCSYFIQKRVFTQHYKFWDTSYFFRDTESKPLERSFDILKKMFSIPTTPFHHTVFCTLSSPI